MVDWKVSVMSGGKVAVFLGPTQMERAPVVWPPAAALFRKSVTVTVRMQLLQVLLPGRAVGVKVALAVEAPVHVPVQEEAQL